MKKIIQFLLIILLSCHAFAKTAVVLDFDTEIMEYQDNMGIMTDMLRSELVKTGKVDVVDRKSMNAALQEMNLQMTEYMSEENVKSLGKMLNADLLIIGHVYPLSDYSTEQQEVIEEVDKGLLGKIVGNGTKKTKVLVSIENKKIEVVVQMLEVETLKIISSSSAEFDKWQQFSNYTKQMAKELVAPLLKQNDVSNQILQNMNTVDSNMFEGLWSCEIAHDGITDCYSFTFGENGKLSVDITSVSSKGKTTTASGNGRYIFRENEKILNITINVIKGDISHIKNIVWKSLVNPNADGTAFSYVVPVTYKGKTKNTRCDFYKE